MRKQHDGEADTVLLSDALKVSPWDAMGPHMEKPVLVPCKYVETDELTSVVLAIQMTRRVHRHA